MSTESPRGTGVVRRAGTANAATLWRFKNGTPVAPTDSVLRLFKIGFWFTAIGFAGLGLSRLIADRFFGGEHVFMRTRCGGLTVMTFSFFWLIGTLVLLPTAVLMQRRRMPESEMTIYPWWQWVLLVPYFDRDNDAKVPRWIWMPIFAMGLLLALALFLIFGALGLHRLLTPTGS